MLRSPGSYCKALGLERFERPGFAFVEPCMLEEHHQVVGDHDPPERGLGSPEVLHAKAFQPEVLLELLDAVCLRCARVSSCVLGTQSARPL